ncbi:MAG: G1 family glutamic endopeptidase [Nitrososphaerales archaeon]
MPVYAQSSAPITAVDAKHGAQPVLAGYVAIPKGHHPSMSGSTSTFAVPTLSCSPSAPTPSSIFVGMLDVNGSKDSSSLLFVGILASCNSGTAQYFATVYVPNTASPSPPPVLFTVTPDDVIVVTVAVVSGSITWTVQDTTTPNTQSGALVGVPSLLGAIFGITLFAPQPIPQFGAISFSNVQVSSSSGTIPLGSVRHLPLIMDGSSTHKVIVKPTRVTKGSSSFTLNQLGVGP